MPKFTIEEHQRRMKELLTPKPAQIGQRPEVLEKLLNQARLKRLPLEVEQEL